MEFIRYDNTSWIRKDQILDINYYPLGRDDDSRVYLDLMVSLPGVEKISIDSMVMARKIVQDLTGYVL